MAARRVRLDRTLGPLVVEWIEQKLVHGPGDVQGQPVELPDEVVRFICRCYAIDDQGRRLVRRAVFSRPKGFAKSEDAAFLVCAEALGPVRFAGWGHDGRPLGASVRSPFIPVAATEEGQAGNTYAAVEFMLREGAVSRLDGLDVGLTRTYVPGGGKIEGITAKATSKDGGKETFAVFDETHLYITDELRRLHATIRRNLAKRKSAEPWGLETTTMYAPGENSVAEFAHSYAKKVGRGEIHDPGFLFDHREGPDPATWDFDSDEQLREALAQAYGPAAEWVDLERVIAEARDPMTDRSDIIRYFVNRPAKREQDVFIKAKAWTDRTNPDLDWSELEGEAAAIGLDGSRTWDTTVVAWAVPRDEKILVGARVFSARDYVAHHVFHEGGKIDYDDVEDFIVDRFGFFNITEAAYDPRYLERSAEIIDQRLRAASIIAVEPASKHMREALGMLERLVLDERLEHDGDPVLAAHFGNCAVERGESNEVRRVRKLNARYPIDVVPALALAAWRAVVGDLQASFFMF